LVLAARKDLGQKQQEEIAALDEELQDLNLKLTDAEQFIQADLAALGQRSEELSTELQALDDRLRELTSQAIQKSQEAYDKRAQSERLRNDITRLKTQLAEIRIDHVRGIEQRAKLDDLLIRYEAQAETLKRRHQQLQAATDTTDYDPPPPNNATETDPQAGATE
jgi:chromosome segregation ATPase